MSQAWILEANAWAAVWADNMLRACWQGGLFILSVWALCRLPPLPGRVRCGLWWLACLKLLVGLAWATPISLALLPASPVSSATPPPLLSDSLSVRPITVPPTARSVGRTHMTVTASASHRPALSVLTFPAPASAVAPQRLSLVLVGLCLWLAGVLVYGGITLRQLLWLRRLIPQARPIDAVEILDAARELAETLRLRRPPRLLVTHTPVSPLVLGLLRPVVLICQRDLDRLSASEIRSLLAHELVHLRRGDLWLGLGPALAQTLFFFHPLAWLACREFDVAREAACDAQALEATRTPRHLYGRLLLKLSAANAPSHPAGALGATSNFRSLQRRLLMLQHVSCRVRPRMRMALALLFAIGIACLAPWRVVAAAETPGDPFAGDVRLDQKVAISAEGIPVGDLLALLSSKTGVALTADASVTDDKVVVFGPARPLKSVLSDLAALFNDLWQHDKTRDGKERYTLTRDLRARRYEEGLVQEATRRVRTQLEAQMEAPVRALNETPEQLQRRPENDPIRARLSDARSRLNVLFYAHLSPQQRDQLFAEGRLTIPFTLLSAKEQALLREDFADPSEQSLQVVMTDQPEEIEDHEQMATVTVIGPNDGIAEGDAVSKADAGLDETGPVSLFAVDAVEKRDPKELETGAIQFTLNRVGDHIDLRWIRTYSSLGWPVASTPVHAGWLLPPHGNPYTGKAIEGDTSLPDADTLHSLAKEKDWIAGLRKLAQESGRPLLADYYRGRLLPQPTSDPFAPAPSGSRLAALDAFCQPHDYLWWTRGDTLLLRKRDWYQQRLYEVPDRWMQSVSQRLQAQRGVPTVADVARLRDLTAAQIAGLGNLPFVGQSPKILVCAATADEYEANGLRELLSLLQASPTTSRTPVPVEDDAAGTPNPWTYRDLTLHQKSLLPTFLQAQNTFLPAADIKQFSVRALRTSDEPQSTARGYQCVQIRLDWKLERNASPPGFQLALPLSLPDDRRDKTKIEVVP